MNVHFLKSATQSSNAKFNTTPSVFNTHRLSKKIVEVDLPRLNVQIMHEWTTPSDKKIVEISNDDNKRILKKNEFDIKI